MKIEHCEDALELISARLDGVLSPDEEAALAEHLAHCPACAALAADLETLHTTMPELNAEPPAFLLENVMAQIRAETPAPIPFPAQAAPKKQGVWRRWSAAAAVLVLVAAGALYVGSGNRRGTGSPTPALLDVAGDSGTAGVFSGGAEGGDEAMPMSGPADSEKQSSDALLTDVEPAGGAENESAATPPPSIAPAVAPDPLPTAAPDPAPRTALTTMGAEPTTDADAAEACRRLYEERFADDWPDAETTDTGITLGTRTLTLLGANADGTYCLIALTENGETLDTFAVPTDSELPILSQQESGADFPK